MLAAAGTLAVAGGLLLARRSTPGHGSGGWFTAGRARH